jgi:hypothetical protein
MSKQNLRANYHDVEIRRPEGGLIAIPGLSHVEGVRRLLENWNGPATTPTRSEPPKRSAETREFERTLRSNLAAMQPRQQEQERKAMAPASTHPPAPIISDGRRMRVVSSGTTNYLILDK